MNVSSIGPFAAVSKRDLEDAEEVSEQITTDALTLGEIDPDSEAGDSTDDQENRGFVQILDFMEQEKHRRFSKKSRNQQVLYSKDRLVEKAIGKYNNLDSLEAQLETHGLQLDKSA